LISIDLIFYVQVSNLNLDGLENIIGLADINS